MKTTGIEIQSPFNFAKTSSCVSLAVKKAKRAEWLSNKEIYLAQTNMGERFMTPIKIKEAKDPQVYMMDVVTGSLYDLESKCCLSSDVLKLISYKIDKENGKQILTMKMQELQ
jgi:hypothetical protein